VTEWTAISQVLVPISLAGWVGLLFWSARPWSIREHLEPASRTGDLADVDVLIPARNEVATLRSVVCAALAQGPGIRTIVVDDESDDGTAAAVGLPLEAVRLVRGRPTPTGWTGKLWALEQGRNYLQRPYTLLLDADIHLAPGMVSAMRAKLEGDSLGFVSVLASPTMARASERLLLPPFSFFFRLLYPFRRANDPQSTVAAAAGGCLLIRTDLLHDLDIFREIRDQLIDDCALARLVKEHGVRTWTGLTRGAQSIRPGGGFYGVLAMVERHAYTQLGYSPWALAGVSLAMIVVFVVPVLGLLLPAGTASWGSALAVSAMVGCYLPTLSYYDRSPLWAPLLPLAAVCYLLATWRSAWRYHRAGAAAVWRGRTYLKGESS